MPRYSPRTGLLDTYQVGPFDSTHIYVQWGGSLPGSEEWSCGFRMWKASGSTDADAKSIIAAVGGAILNFHTRTTSHISSGAKLNFVKANAIAVTGAYQEKFTNEVVYPDTPGGGQTVVVHPNQVAWAVSTTTGFSRGPAHRGRWYNPLPDVGTDATDGLTGAGAANDLAVSAQQLLTAVNAAGSGHVMVVMSRKAGAPGHRAVTGIQVGRVLDTQRRRRGSLPETYQTVGS